MRLRIDPCEMFEILTSSFLLVYYQFDACAIIRTSR